MRNMGEANARLKQMEVALDAAELDKQNAETQAALAHESAEASKLEVKRVDLMVRVIPIILNFLVCNFKLLSFC